MGMNFIPYIISVCVTAIKTNNFSFKYFCEQLYFEVLNFTVRLKSAKKGIHVGRKKSLWNKFKTITIISLRFLFNENNMNKIDDEIKLVRFRLYDE